MSAVLTKVRPLPIDVPISIRELAKRTGTNAKTLLDRLRMTQRRHPHLKILVKLNESESPAGHRYALANVATLRETPEWANFGMPFVGPEEYERLALELKALKTEVNSLRARLRKSEEVSRRFAEVVDRVCAALD